jgi:hypothetical protein
MRLLKAQNTNLRNIYGKGVKYDVNDQVILDSNNVMLIPKGTTAQRPASPVNGHMRFNTSLDGDGVVIGFEVYYDSDGAGAEAGAWKRLRYKEPNTNPGIVKQDLGVGDAVEVYFGPLDSGDPDFPIPVDGNHILVFVENVIQFNDTNYTLEQNPGVTFTIVDVVSAGTTTVIELDGAHGLTAGHEVFIDGVETDPDDAIENLNSNYSGSPGHHNVVSVPSATQLEIGVDTSGGTVGNYTANSGTMITYIPGWYIKFNEAVPISKPVVVLHNFDK